MVTEKEQIQKFKELLSETKKELDLIAKLRAEELKNAALDLQFDEIIFKNSKAGYDEAVENQCKFWEFVTLAKEAFGDDIVPK